MIPNENIQILMAERPAPVASFQADSMHASLAALGYDGVVNHRSPTFFKDFRQT